MRAGFFQCLTANQASAEWTNTTEGKPLQPATKHKSSFIREIASFASSRPGLCSVSCCKYLQSLNKKLYSTLSRSTHVYKCVPANCCGLLAEKLRGGGGTLEWTGILPKAPSRYMLQKPELSADIRNYFSWFVQSTASDTSPYLTSGFLKSVHGFQILI